MPYSDLAAAHQRSESTLCLADCSYRQITPLWGKSVDFFFFLKYINANKYTDTCYDDAAACIHTCTHSLRWSVVLLGLMSSVSLFVRLSLPLLCSVLQHRVHAIWFHQGKTNWAFHAFHFYSHKTRNCPLVQTNAPLAVLCTCYLAHQPSSTFCQVHLSASPTLKFALRFGHKEVALDMRRAICSYEFQNIRFAELPKFIMSSKRSAELILFKCFFLYSVLPLERTKCYCFYRCSKYCELCVSKFPFFSNS